MCMHRGSSGGELLMLEFYRPLVTLYSINGKNEQMVAAPERNVLRVQSKT